MVAISDITDFYIITNRQIIAIGIQNIFFSTEVHLFEIGLRVICIQRINSESENIHLCKYFQRDWLLLMDRGSGVQLKSRYSFYKK